MDREETTFDEVVRRIRDGSFYNDYDWASGPALRALERQESRERQLIEAEIARDTAGFLGSVADGIRCFSDELKASETKNDSLRAALQPFADCCEYIKKSEDDDEWAKFRLVIKNYRDARDALA